MLVVTKNDKALRTPHRGLLASPDRPDGFFVNIHDKPGPVMAGPRRSASTATATSSRTGSWRPRSWYRRRRSFKPNRAAREIVKLVIDGVGAFDKPEGLSPQVLDLQRQAFALPLVKAGARVTAVEENGQATKDAEANIRLNRIPDGRIRLITATGERRRASPGLVGRRHPRFRRAGVPAGSAGSRV